MRNDAESGFPDQARDNAQTPHNEPAHEPSQSSNDTSANADVEKGASNDIDNPGFVDKSLPHSKSREKQLLEKAQHDVATAHERHVSLKERLTHFTWPWFECTMSTGAIATLLSQAEHAYTFRGLQTIGKIFFILDLVLFAVFCVCITTRFILKPAALRLSLHHPHESHYFGTFWVSIALILYCIQQYAVASCGPWLVKTLEVLFWIYAGCALLVAVFQYHVIFDEENLPVVDAMPAWILPLYPFLVTGPLAAVLLYSQPQTAAIPIFIGGITFQGLGWMFAFMIFTIYLTRLINSDLPVESKRPAMFVAVGPAAYTSNTLVALGTRAPYVIPEHFLGIQTLTVGDAWKAFSVPCGIFLWLLAFWFFAITLVSNVTGYKRMRFTLSWWAFIFPNVGLTVAAIYIGDVLDSNGIRAVTSAMTIMLVAVWIFVAIMNVKAVYQRKVLWPGMDEDMEDIEGHRQDNIQRGLSDLLGFCTT